MPVKWVARQIELTQPIPANGEGTELHHRITSGRHLGDAGVEGEPLPQRLTGPVAR
jgi:hypothetical protein